MAEKEWWDVYTKDRQLTGRKHERGMPMKEGEYHLTVHVCIFNSKNQLLIQQRQPFKQGWPNMWALSAGGSALAGETSSQAAERETWEELGLKLDLSGIRPQFTINFSEGFGDYYFVEKDAALSELKPDADEVRQVRWATQEEISQMVEEGTMIPCWFMDKLFEIRNYQDAYRTCSNELRIVSAEKKHLASWMSLVEIVRQGFPGLETEEALADYRNTVVKNMERGSALCALDGNVVVGILLFSPEKSSLDCLAVHPECRRRGIASGLIKEMRNRLDPCRDVVVETFREGDEKGAAPRALYQSLGFVPGQESLFQGRYPVQEFVLKGEKVEK